MQVRPLVRSARWLLPLALIAATPVWGAGEIAPVKLKNGALCQVQKHDAFEGETHRCYFSPKRFGKRDFSARNARAMYVISELGPDCDEIEILADGTSEAVASDGGELKQVTVHCDN